MERLTRLLPLLLLVLLLSGCAGREAEITVDLGVLHSGSSESAAEAIEQVQEKMKGWESEHPGITVEERQRIKNADFTSLAVFGGDHLPDVFITDSCTGALLSKRGLALDLRSYSRGNDTFLQDGSVYALPVLQESVSVVVYRRGSWKRGDAVAYCAAQGLTSDYLSAVLSDEIGQHWLEHMVGEDEQAAFTDSFFVERLGSVRTQALSGICYDSADELIADFVRGNVQAVLMSADAVYRLLEQTREQNPALYQQIEFSTLSEHALPRGYTYGVVLNAQLLKNPVKLVKCVSLLHTLTTPKTERVEDETVGRLEQLKRESKSARIVSQCFTNLFWLFAQEQCFSQLTDRLQPDEEYGAILQNLYEQYCFSRKDNTLELIESARFFEKSL